jgi:hypothetical protein
MLDKAVAALKGDREVALAMFNKGEGGFVDRDLNAFCFRVSDGKAVASPIFIPAGTNAFMQKDSAGKAYGQELYAAVQKPEGQITEVVHEAAKALEEHNKQDNVSPAMVDNGIARDPNYQGKGLELEFTVEDEGVFTSPWSASMIYWPPLMRMGKWPEITCVEGAKDYNGRNFAKKALIPTADKPDF